jgi:hypothetical protein
MGWGEKACDKKRVVVVVAVAVVAAANNNNNNNNNSNSGKSLLCREYISRTSLEFDTFAMFVTLSYRLYFMSGFEGCSYSYPHTKFSFSECFIRFAACKLKSEWQFPYWSRIHTFTKNRQLTTIENAFCGENSCFYILFTFSFKASGADSVRCSSIGS